MNGSTTGQTTLEETMRLLARSSRAVARYALARYRTDLISSSYRRDFDRIWSTVEQIPGWFNEGSAALLYGQMRETPPTTLVEIGSYLGRSTVFFALAMRQLAPTGRVVAIDPHTGDRQQLESLTAERLPSFELFSEHCRAAGVDDLVEPMVMTSLEAAVSWSGDIDLLFVDGWHSYPAVIEDGEAWLPHLSAGGIVVFDDYLAYEDVRRAVDELAARGLFRLWGSVFGQAIGGVAAEPPPSARRALVLSSNALTRLLSRRGAG